MKVTYGLASGRLDGLVKERYPGRQLGGFRVARTLGRCGAAHWALRVFWSRNHCDIVPTVSKMLHCRLPSVADVAQCDTPGTVNCALRNPHLYITPMQHRGRTLIKKHKTSAWKLGHGVYVLGRAGAWGAGTESHGAGTCSPRLDSAAIAEPL